MKTYRNLLINSCSIYFRWLLWSSGCVKKGVMRTSTHSFSESFELIKKLDQEGGWLGKSVQFQMHAQHKIERGRRDGLSLKVYSVKPLKMATLRGVQNWPSYRGGSLMETLHLSTIDKSTCLEGFQVGQNGHKYIE